ncbi:hypothetical protein PHYPSEUDO_015432 [Phytophthora pseudosyringae]|uniref:Uncharacterized protein n=1 Tax=Phytophthora pseudosyringae TaxID=221518 RepID=A0A8T1W265_9STRA|nr:hypothetical protein PHYPSEUDO_015432 [Phytophthora pseudosyringae]
MSTNGEMYEQLRQFTNRASSSTNGEMYEQPLPVTNRASSTFTNVLMGSEGGAAQDYQWVGFCLPELKRPLRQWRRAFYYLYGSDLAETGSVGGHNAQLSPVFLDGTPMYMDDVKDFDPKVDKSMTWRLESDGVEALNLTSA